MHKILLQDRNFGFAMVAMMVYNIKMCILDLFVHSNIIARYVYDNEFSIYCPIEKGIAFQKFAILDYESSEQNLTSKSKAYIDVSNFSFHSVLFIATDITLLKWRVVDLISIFSRSLCISYMNFPNVIVKKYLI